MHRDHGRLFQTLAHSASQVRQRREAVQQAVWQSISCSQSAMRIISSARHKDTARTRVAQILREIRSLSGKWSRGWLLTLRHLLLPERHSQALGV